MPPSLPTGTVSRPPAGTRTFPPDADSTTDADAEERERVAAGPAESASPSTTARPARPSAGVVSRREHDVALARAHERVDELEAENDALRDYIERQAAERRAVIERYERLLDRRDATRAAPEGSASPTSPPGVVDGIRSALVALRSRLATVVRRD